MISNNIPEVFSFHVIVMRHVICFPSLPLAYICTYPNGYPISPRLLPSSLPNLCPPSLPCVLPPYSLVPSVPSLYASHKWFNRLKTLNPREIGVGIVIECNRKIRPELYCIILMPSFTVWHPCDTPTVLPIAPQASRLPSAGVYRLIVCLGRQ